MATAEPVDIVCGREVSILVERKSFIWFILKPISKLVLVGYEATEMFAFSNECVWHRTIPSSPH